MDVIEVEGLEKTYRDGTRAVKGIDFQVRDGEFFGLLGPNGAGKTTTMRILGTLHRHTGGRARVLGLDIQEDAAKIKRRIGFAMQEVGMDDLATADEMIRFHARLYGIGRVEARSRAKELLETFGLWDHRKRRVTRFSGGMQRRLDLAVSLIHTPELLFLDEPSTGLDPASRSGLWKTLRRLQRDEGIAILMSTHYMEEADALSDRIAIMSQGAISAIDTPEALKQSVGADVVEAGLLEAPGPDQRRDLAGIFGADNLQFTDGVVRVKVRDGRKALLPALRHMDRVGLRIGSTQVKSPSLDDAFLKYTGQSLEAEEEDAPSAAAAAGASASGAAAVEGTL